MKTLAGVRPVRIAARVRKQIGNEAGPFCAADCAEKLGIEVRFLAIGSLEGMYVRAEPPQILVGADRPKGRQAMTIAHELGHHALGHAMHLSLEDAKEARSTEEWEADLFAAHFLMPRALVLQAFAARGYPTNGPTPEQVFIVAGWLGVSYEALLRQMAHAFGFMPTHKVRDLLKVAPKEIRRRLWQRHGTRLHSETPVGDIVVVDSLWGGRPVDLHTGDVALVPAATTKLNGMVDVEDCVVFARSPGLNRIQLPTGEVLFVRVSRSKYAGSARFRHLETVADDEVVHQ